MEKIIDKKRSIGDASKELGLETHVIRFWESKFPQIKPKIGKGDRRYYFDKEIAVLAKIKSLLHDEGYSIAGLQKLLKKRKKSDLKEQNLEFLLAENIVDDLKKDAEEFSIDDFISPDVDLAKGDDAADSINQIIARIEFNLKKLEQI
ncbi:MAG: MerR family transcriptional regulator [Pseudomonadota bacterium]